MRQLIKCLFALELLTTAIASQATNEDQIIPAVSFQGRSIRFAMRERPFYSGRSPMVAVRTVCLAIGAGVRSSRDARQWTITRGSDRIDCTVGTPWFNFNGTRQNMQEAPELRDKVLFVPMEMVQAISGGGLDAKATYGPEREASVFFLNKLVHFRPEEMPFRDRETVFVSVRPATAVLGAKLEISRDGSRLTITRSRDKLVYEEGSHWFLFNDAERSLRTESTTRGKNIFVPIDLLQAFVGQELSSR